MDTFWIQYSIVLFYGLCLLNQSTYCEMETDVEVHLVVRKYVEKGSSVTLHCEHNVAINKLYKVTWLKSGFGKLFQFINGRSPPFKNFSFPGAEIDWSNSNEAQLTMKSLSFEADGLYYCEVSTDKPIYTKMSLEEQLYIILPQTEPPRIVFSKRQFEVSENLIANCTTSKSRPPPHITWLLNGRKVDDKYTRTLHLATKGIVGVGATIPNGGGNIGYGKSNHRSKSNHQQQLRNNPSYEIYESALIDKPFDYKDSLPQPFDYNNNDRYGFGHSYESYVPNPNTNQRYYRSHFDDLININDDEEGNYYSLIPQKYRNRKNRRSSIINDLNGNSGTRNAIHRTAPSSSQLSIEVEKLKDEPNGRIEITCLATIPAHVGPGEQYADYKTYSVKIDIQQSESTSSYPSVDRRAAIGSSAAGYQCFNFILINLPILVFMEYFFTNFRR